MKIADVALEGQDDSIRSLFFKELHLQHKILGIIIAGWALALSFYQILICYFPAPEALVHRSIHLTFALVLVFLIKPTGREVNKKINAYFLIDLTLIILSLFIHFYIVINHVAFENRQGIPNSLDIIVGTMLIIIILEATRRTIGLPLVIVAIFFLFHAMFSEHFPGVFFSPSLKWTNVIDTNFMMQHGIYGVPLQCISTFVAIFIIFGAVLLKTGAADFFIDLSYSLTRKASGGPAKTAVISSGLIGTMMGTSIGNVMTTGTFTIPLMKRTGLSSEFAAAIETLASNGGTLMPPMLGATVFIMVQFTGMSYWEIVKIAFPPALLLYTAIYITVHFHSKKKNLVLSSTDISYDSPINIIKKRGYLILPLFVIIGMLATGKSVMITGLIATIFCIVISFIRPETRINMEKFVEALIDAAKSLVVISVACGTAGLIIGTIYCSGLGMNLSLSLVALAGGKLWLGLILAAIVCIILGMGIAPIAVYITAASLMIPPLIQMGSHHIGTHFFVLYFSEVAMITPPVAVTAFAAAGVARSSPMRTAALASWLGIATYIIPFCFIYHPAILLQGNVLEILIALLTAFMGIIALSACTTGWLISDLKAIERAVLFLAGIGLISSNVPAEIVGFIALTTIITYRKINYQKV